MAKLFCRIIFVVSIAYCYFDTDLTLTTERLMELFASVDDENVDGVSSYFSIPSSKVDELQINYQNSTQRMEAYFDCYVHYLLGGGWL